MAVRTIGTDIKLTGEKEFNDGMKNINSNLKTLRSDMALVSAEFEDNADSVEALNARQKILSDSVDQHREKVNALRQMYEKQVAASGEASGAADKYKQQLNSASVALLKEEKALQKNTTALELAKSKAADMEKASEEVADATDDVAKSANKAADSLDEMGDKAAKSESKLGSVVSGLGHVAAGAAKASAAVLAAGAAMGAALLTGIVGFAKEAAEAAKAASEAGETLTASQQQWLAYSNQLDTLGTSVANAKSALAGTLLPVLGDLSTEGSAFLSDFSRDMEAAAGDAGKQGQVLSNYIVRGANLIKEKLPEYMKLGKELFAGLGAGLSEAGPEILDMGVDLVMELLNQIIAFAPELVSAGFMLVEKLAQGIIDQGPDVANSAVDLIISLVSGIGQAAPTLIPAAASLVTQLITALIERAPELLLAGLELVFGVVGGILMGLGDIGNAVEQIIGMILETFAEYGSKLLSIGEDVVAKIKEGISSAWEGLKNWFNNLWDSLFSNREVNVNVNKSSSGADGQHASGLDYVPFDGYLAQLHRGEMVLNSFDADRYRRAGKEAGTKIVNLTINAKSLSPAEVEWLVAYINGKLGDDM